MKPLKNTMGLFQLSIRNKKGAVSFDTALYINNNNTIGGCYYYFDTRTPNNANVSPVQLGGNSSKYSISTLCVLVDSLS